MASPLRLLRSLLAITAAFILEQTAAVITGSVTNNPTIVASTSTLQFELSFSTLIPANGYILLQFSSGFDFSQSTGIGCTQIYGMMFMTNCQTLTNQQIKINNAQTQDYLVIFTVNNVVLPNYVNSFFVVATSYNAGGTQLETSGTTAIKITTTPQLMTVTLTPDNQTVAAYSNLQINIASAMLVPSTSVIEVDFPKWNSGTQTLGLETSMFNLQLLNYDGVSGTYSLPCTSALNPTIVCTLNVGQASSVQQIVSTFDTVRMSSFNQNSNSLAVTFILNVFQNPPSTRPITNIDATQYNSAGYLMQQQQNINLKVSIPAVMQGSYATISTLLGSINSQDTYTFTFYMTLPLPVGSVVQIGVPSQVSINSYSDSSVLILNSANGYSPIFSVPQVQIKNAATQQVLVTNLVPTNQYYVDAGNYVKFDLLYFTNPSSIKPTDPFAITFYDQNNIIMTVSPGPILTATPGKFQSIYIQPENYRVRQANPYTFGFITTNKLFQTGYIVINVPPEIGVNPNNLTVQGVTTVSQYTNLTISFNASNNQLIITNAFTQTYLTPQLVEFIVTSGLINAADTEPTSSFVISTVDQYGQIIDSGTSASLTFTANQIQNITATACSNLQTASQTQDVCTYKLLFTIGAQFPILSGSTIQITLPDDLKLLDSSITSSKSSTQGVSDLSSRFSVTSDMKSVIVSNAFLQISAPNGVDYRQDSFAVMIAGIISPRTTAPTLSFQAWIRSSSNYMEYQRVQGVYSNVYQARPFTKTVIMRNNEINGNQGSYNFTLQFASQVYKNEYIKITPPPSVIISVGQQNQCVGLRLLNPQLTCTMIQGSMYIMIMPLNPNQQFFNPGDIVQFQVNNITNPLSLEPTASFSIYISTDKSNNYFINQMNQGLSVMNQFDGELYDVQVLPYNSQFSAQTSYTIYFNNANIIPQGGYIQIMWPQEFYQIYPNITCQAITNINPMLFCNTTGTNQINIYNGFTQPANPGTIIGFKLNNIRNPSVSVNSTTISQNFFITTFTPNSYSIDQTQNLNFTIGCNFPCASCTSDQNVCTSCQIINGLHMVLYQGSCSSACPAGYYTDSNYNCQQCNYPCAQCNQNKDFCDSCLPTSGLPYVSQQGQCFKDCPQGTFANPSLLTCDPCVGQCSTCLNQGECLSCKSGYYFLDNQCYSSCPLTSIQFASTEVQECLDCIYPCATCNSTVDSCTSCEAGLFLYQSSCVEKCPVTYQPNDVNVCYLASQFTLPFITMTATVIIIIVVLVSKFKCPDTKPVSAYLGLQIPWMVCFWVYMLGWLISDQYKASSTLVAVALLVNYVINYWWFEYYKARIVQHDQLYRVYKDANPKSHKAIIIMSMLTSFQLFRISYCKLFNAPGLSAQLSNRQKYYKKMNRLTHFQLSFVFVPTIIAAIYNLFFTWYGRQCFWNDIENLVQCTQTMILMILVLFRSQIHYIAKITMEDELGVGQAKFKTETPEVKDLADKIATEGFEHEKSKLKDLPAETKMDVITAWFNRMVKGKPVQNKKMVTESQFVTTHGQKTEKFNKAYQSEKVDLKLKKGQLNQSPDKYNKVAETNVTVVENTDNNMTDLNQFEDTQKIPLRNSDTLRLNKEQDENGTDQRNQIGKSKFVSGDDELFNFHSAPLNAQSALKGNAGLQERYQGLLNQLDKVKKKPVKKPASKARNNMTRGAGSQISMESDANLSFEKQNELLPEQLTDRSKIYEMPEDSDDLQDKFTSEKYGEGTSKVVAAHYNTLQDRSSSQTKTSNVNKDSKGFQQAEKSTIPNQIRQTKLTHEDMLRMIDEIKKLQHDKKQAKIRIDDFEGQKDVIAENVSKAKDKNVEITRMIKDLEVQIAEEIERLEKVRRLKDQDVQFVENAFYTSNEEGMGVSPSAYTNQNAIPRVAKRLRSPPKQETTEQIQMEDQILREADKLSNLIPSSYYPEKNVDMFADKARKQSNHSGRAETMESGRKKSGLDESGQSNVPKIKKIVSGSQKAPKRKTGPRSTNSNPVATLDRHQEQNETQQSGISDTRKNKFKLKQSQGRKTESENGSQSFYQKIQSSRGSLKGGMGKSKTAEFGEDTNKNSENKSQGRVRSRNPAALLLSGSSNNLEIKSPQNTKVKKPGARSKGGLSAQLSQISEGTLNAKNRNKMSETVRSSLNGSNSRLGVIKESKSKSKANLTSQSFRNDELAKGKGKMQMKPISKTREGMEYVTSEDSQGLPIKKLKKKRGIKGIGNGSISSGQLIQSESDSMEYYTSEDKNGIKVQKLRRKVKKFGLKAIQERNLAKSKLKKGASDKSDGVKSLQRKVSGSRGTVTTKPFDFTKNNKMSRDTSNEDTQAVALTDRVKKKNLGSNTKSVDRSTGLKDSAYKLNQLAGITTSTFNDGNSYLRGHSTLQEAGLLQTQFKNRVAAGLPQPPMPDYQVTTLSDEKPKKKKKSQPPAHQRDYTGVYFKHTQFERAVIATNGRAPYNNKEVEMISKHQLEKLNQESFKNNWVNQLIKDQPAHSRSPRGLRGSPRSQLRATSVASASQTARTIFQGRLDSGLDQHNLPFGSVQQTEFNQPQAPQVIRNQEGGSPVTMLGKDSKLQVGYNNDLGNIDQKEGPFTIRKRAEADSLPIYKHNLKQNKGNNLN